ncbi:MAG: DNA polymerase Y family protein [Proteobacteria bacterium]|nr:DNA polymerase Y family protein [Pseudomonadota bacterium]
MLWACIHLPYLGPDGLLRHRPADDIMQSRELSDARVADEAQWLSLLCAWSYRFSSRVAPWGSDAILLEAAGSLPLFGDWPTLRLRLQEGLQALGFRHRIALAPTARAARVLAGIADGLSASDLPQLRRMLERIAIRQALLPGDAGERLHRMGIRHLRQLFELPRDALQRRFGAELSAALDRMLGQAEEFLICYQPPERFEQRVEFSHEICHHEALLFPARRMTADLAAFLVARDGGVQRFRIELEHRGVPPTVIGIGLLAPERDAGLLFECVQGRLASVQLPDPVTALRLCVTELPPFVPAAHDLFDAMPSQSLAWPQLRERLRARLGDGAVYQLTPTVDPRPEHAWARAGVGRIAPAPERPARPTWLLPRPMPLCSSDLQILSGPERLESGWWDGGDVRRDYYVLQLPTGQRAWAFCHPGERGNWMVHGWFA